MGPASLRAIKEGEINQSYDTAFVLAEVNGDERYLQQNKDRKWEIVSRDNKVVGKIKLSLNGVKKHGLLFHILFMKVTKVLGTYVCYFSFI